jgi:allantoicase
VATCERHEEPILKSKKPLTISFNEEPREIKANTRVDWASQAFGARVVHATNEHYGPAAQVISPFSPLHMFDGLESARSRKLGHYEEVIIEFAKAIEIREIIFDFSFFVNNNPRELKILALENNSWVTIEEKVFAKPFAGSFLKLPSQKKGLFTQLKVQTIPDGGINRIHVYST